MIVKTSKKRTEFERTLKRLGYRDQSPIFLKNFTNKKYHRKLEKILKKLNCNYNPIILQSGQKIEHEILKNLSQNSYSIFYFTIPYFNKKTYLYNFFLENYKNFSKKEMRQELKILTKNILYHEKSRICEVGWHINNTQALIFSSPERVKKIYLEVIKKGKKDFITGDHLLNPKEGDILVSKPMGGKFLGRGDERIFLLAKNQRARINTKFGFGLLKEHDSQYARYDKNLIPKPI